MTGRSDEPTRPHQLVFDLAQAPSYAAEDFLVSKSNGRAFASVTAWPGWVDRVLLLVGPEGSGKSHLAAIWAERANAQRLDDPSGLGSDLDLSRAYLIEDLERRTLRERGIFHFLNGLREGNGWLLLTARTPPDQWGLEVADLLSRLRLAPTVAIQHPDEALMAAVLVKLFSDKQICIDEDVIAYAARHCDQSLAAAKRFVDAIDRDSLASGSRITRPLAARTLARLASPTS